MIAYACISWPTWVGKVTVIGITLSMLCLLGCGGGSMSSGGPPPSPTSTTNLTWDITDSCNNGQQIYLRFFDRTDHVQWPSDTSQVYVLNYKDDNKYTLSCVTNAQICYGASVAGNTTGYWGDGENGDQGCTDCCFKCVSNPIQPIALTCP
jgi:hypothetical protein